MAGACLGVVVLLGDGAEPRHVSELTLVSGVCAFIILADHCTYPHRESLFRPHLS